ncbi:hypothetical protein LXH13_06170 [Streptomyces spinosirectus]|jgi:hypothetical protein|uniref:hypothetical protein n=1 Tax=Streptomyces TaxID=1883 RepID=UPI001C9D7345|nr:MULTISPECIES: hypothetical protein [Streptomyces]MBY8342009.1 hypothetical protein [Streptomyces plumbidurans]UIR16644.1 hypothetical protein LXH13_06170 [Streptomyces spinosirectus]
MRVIVAAAGSQKKWGGHLGVRSHFAPVRSVLEGDEPAVPLLERTLTQLAAYTSDVWLTVPADEPGPYEALAAAHGARTHQADAAARNEFESSRPVWRPDTVNVLLLGDVWFTDRALDTILTAAAVTSTDDDGFRFFGREHASTVTGTPWGEIFANSWRGRNNDRMSALTDATRREQDAGRADPTKHGWTILRMLQGTPLRQHEVRPPWWVEIDDATDDLDFPDDYRRHPATRGLTPGGTACA